MTAKTRAHDKGCNTIRLLLIKTHELDAEIDNLKSKEVIYFVVVFALHYKITFIKCSLLTKPISFHCTAFAYAYQHQHTGRSELLKS